MGSEQKTSEINSEEIVVWIQSMNFSHEVQIEGAKIATELMRYLLMMRMLRTAHDNSNAADVRDSIKLGVALCLKGIEETQDAE